jgi:hypothetical protein
MDDRDFELMGESDSDRGRDPDLGSSERNSEHVRSDSLREREAAADREFERIRRDYLENDACHLRATGNDRERDVENRGSSCGMTREDKDIEQKTKEFEDFLREEEGEFITEEHYKNLDATGKAAALACSLLDPIADRVTNTAVQDRLRAASAVCEKFVEMKAWNHKEKNWDKFFHCEGMCEGAGLGKDGGSFARDIGMMRESIWNDTDSHNDLVANERGILGELRGIRCSDACRDYIPGRYRGDYK